MFDFGFSELMVVMVVALIVLGPERLPKVARTMGSLWARSKRYVNSVKADIEREIEIEEFRKLQETVQAEANEVGQSVKQMTLTVDQQLQQINETIAKLAVPGSANLASSSAAAQVPLQSAPDALPSPATDVVPQSTAEQPAKASGTAPTNIPQ